MMEKFNINLSQERCFLNLQYFFKQQVSVYGKKYKTDDEQSECLNEIASWLVETKGKWGLLLAGVTGNGKTITVKAMRTFVNACKITDPIPTIGTWTLNAGIWMINARELNKMFVKDNATFEKCKDTYILAIDDLGVEDTIVYWEGNRYKPMEDILYYRYERMLTTIVTTNLPLAMIREKYGDRLGDRFNEMFLIIHMPDRNFRN